MNPTQRKELLSLIESRIAETKKEIVDLEAMIDPVSPDNAIGRLSRLEAINSQQMHEAALRLARASLDSLKHTLDAVDEDDFGICVDCDEDIPMGRLRAKPDATRCIECEQESGDIQDKMLANVSKQGASKGVV